MTELHFPGRRLATFYFVFFAGVGAFMPYWSLYLESLGIDAATIGWMMASMMATRIVAPNLWGWIADRRGRRMGVIRFGACVALLCFAAVPSTTNAVPLTLLMILYSVFWTAVLPQFEAVTLAHLGARSARYSRIRLWGSVGFVIASALVGWILDQTGALALPWIMLLFIAAVVAMSFVVGEPPRRPSRATTCDNGPRATHIRAIICLLLACAAMQASHGPYYVFFSIYLTGLGYSGSEIGALWALGVVAEVVLFAVMPSVLAKSAPGPLFTACFALTALRWLALALLPASLPILVVVQVLHAISFGAFHALAIALLHRLFTNAQQGRGQALYSSLSFGAGGALGSAAAGWLWAGVGADGAWLAAAAMAVVGGIVALGIGSVGSLRYHRV
ncbi:MAG: PPP family 3-phenylpropionic acid transporter [Gammaproteobacteria bacterium]|jgi:PPP family 3-phenylpropionic acid transporter